MPDENTCCTGAAIHDTLHFLLHVCDANAAPATNADAHTVSSVPLLVSGTHASTFLRTDVPSLRTPETQARIREAITQMISRPSLYVLDATVVRDTHVLALVNTTMCTT